MGKNQCIALVASAFLFGCGPSSMDGSIEDLTCTPSAATCSANLEAQSVCRVDGSGWEETSCMEGPCDESSGRCAVRDQLCDLRIFVLLDQSGSMDGTKWDQARSALSTLMTSEAAENVEFGFGAFPEDESCGSSNPVIDMIPNATAASVDSYLAGHEPVGGTPLADALSGLLGSSSTGLLDRDYHNVLLVVSDGEDSCSGTDEAAACIAGCDVFDILCPFECADSFPAPPPEVVAEDIGNSVRSLRDDHEIRSYAIGFGDNVGDLQLTTIAENGGSALGSWVPANDVSELEHALQTILSDIQDCNPIIID